MNDFRVHLLKGRHTSKTDWHMNVSKECLQMIHILYFNLTVYNRPWESSIHSNIPMTQAVIDGCKSESERNTRWQMFAKI